MYLFAAQNIIYKLILVERIEKEKDLEIKAELKKGNIVTTGGPTERDTGQAHQVKTSLQVYSYLNPTNYKKLKD
jgi:hypothetical protein